MGIRDAPPKQTNRFMMDTQNRSLVSMRFVAPDRYAALKATGKLLSPGRRLAIIHLLQRDDYRVADLVQLVNPTRRSPGAFSTSPTPPFSAVRARSFRCAGRSSRSALSACATW